MGAGDGECSIVVTAVRADVLPFQFWNRILAICRVCLHGWNVSVLPMHLASSSRATRLQAGASVKDDQNVFAKRLTLFLLTFSETFARGNHQNNGNDPPGDAKHRQERA